MNILLLMVLAVLKYFQLCIIFLPLHDPLRKPFYLNGEDTDPDLASLWFPLAFCVFILFSVFLANFCAKGDSFENLSARLSSMGYSQQLPLNEVLQQYGPLGASQLRHCPSTESNESKHINTRTPAMIN